MLMGGAASRRYAEAESRFRGLVGTTSARAKLFAYVSLGLLVLNVFQNFWYTRVIAGIQTAGPDVRVLVLDGHGDGIAVPMVRAADWDGPNAGMIVDQLRRSIDCVRGLSTDARAVNACWERELGWKDRVGKSHAGKFVGRAAVMLGEYANREFAPNAEALAERLARESVQIQHLGVTHPDDARWALQWRERVIDRSGRTTSERVMTGTFTVQIVPLTQVDIERNTTGLQITYYDWAQDSSR